MGPLLRSEIRTRDLSFRHARRVVKTPSESGPQVRYIPLRPEERAHRCPVLPVGVTVATNAPPTTPAVADAEGLKVQNPARAGSGHSASSL